MLLLVLIGVAESEKSCSFWFTMRVYLELFFFYFNCVSFFPFWFNLRAGCGMDGCLNYL